MVFHGPFGTMESSNGSTMEIMALSDVMDTSTTFNDNEFVKRAPLIIGGKQYVRDHLESK